MEAVQITRTGGPEVLETIERPVRTPGPGEVLIKAHAIGVAYFDMLIRSGGYPWMPKLPYVPGNEMSGHVVDANGTDLKEGQPVYVANWDNEYRAASMQTISSPPRVPCGHLLRTQTLIEPRPCQITSLRPAYWNTRRPL